MNILRGLLVIQFLVVTGYTIGVVADHGTDLAPVFLADIYAHDWSGQFNLDFAMYLLLSGLWIMWRHHFRLAGIGLGLIGMVGGMMYFPLYVLAASFQGNRDMKTLLIGPERASV